MWRFLGIKSYILSRGHSVFGRKKLIFFWRFVSRSDIPKFREYFSRFLCKHYQGKLTTLLEPLQRGFLHHVKFAIELGLLSSVSAYLSEI